MARAAPSYDPRESKENAKLAPGTSTHALGDACRPQTANAKFPAAASFLA